MAFADRFARWLSQPGNVNLVLAALAGAAGVCLWLAGTGSPLP